MTTTTVDLRSISNSSGRLATCSELERFFADINHELKFAEVYQRRVAKKKAQRFNVFDLIEPDENKLSDIIADLLDPNGTHGQGGLFLHLFFRQLGLRASIGDTNNSTVLREATTHGIQKYRRRIDILVESSVLVAIENKVDSLEQPDQVNDYLNHLQWCTKDNKKPSVLIFLTPDGRAPKSVNKESSKTSQLNCWSYHVQLRQWLSACHRECAAPKIRIFLDDFATYIESSLRR